MKIFIKMFACYKIALYIYKTIKKNKNTMKTLIYNGVKFEYTSFELLNTFSFGYEVELFKGEISVCKILISEDKLNKL